MSGRPPGTTTDPCCRSHAAWDLGSVSLAMILPQSNTHIYYLLHDIILGSFVKYLAVIKTAHSSSIPLISNLIPRPPTLVQ